MQRQELQRQAQDSETNRQALSREKREQFLTRALLNATEDLRQATEAKMNFSLGDDDYARLEGLREARKLKQQISILLCEARLGFDADWNVEIEKRAIQDYLKTYFSELLYRCSVNHTSPLALFAAAIEREMLEINTLCNQIRERHPMTADSVLQFMNFLTSVSNRDEVAQHIENYLKTGVSNL